MYKQSCEEEWEIVAKLDVKCYIQTEYFCTDKVHFPFVSLLGGDKFGNWKYMLASKLHQVEITFLISKVLESIFNKLKTKHWCMRRMIWKLEQNAATNNLQSTHLFKIQWSNSALWTWTANYEYFHIIIDFKYRK